MVWSDVLKKAGGVIGSKAAGGASAGMSMMNAGTQALAYGGGQIISNVATAAVGGAGGKYIGSDQGRAISAFILTVVFSIIDIGVFGLQPSPMRTASHFIFVGAIAMLVLDGPKRIGGTLLALVLAQGLSGLVFYLMDSSSWKSVLFNLDFSAINPQLIIDTIIHAGLSWIILGIVLLIFIKKDILEIEVPLIVGFFLAIYIVPIFKAIEVVLLQTGFSSFEAVIAGIISILYLFPTWILILQVSDLARPVGFVRWIERALFIIVLIAIAIQFSFVLYAGGYGEDGINPKEVAVKVWEFIKTTFTRGYDAAVIGINTTKTNLGRDIAAAQGKDFESDVEQGAIRDVGLNLLPLETSPKEIHLDDAVTVFATLEAKTFDAPIRANASCSITPSRNEIDKSFQGKLPQSTFFISDYANTQLACRFDKGDIKLRGSATAKVSVDFDYAASAYLQRYFTKPGFMSQYSNSRRAPEDLFFQELGISRDVKESVRTQGPVDLALTTPTVVTELLPSQFQQSTIFLQVGLESLRRGWTGKLKEVHRVIISVPNEFIINTRTQEEEPETGANGEFTVGGVTTDVPDCTDAGLDAEIILLDSGTCRTYEDSYGLSGLDCDRYQHIIITPSPERKNQTEKDVVLGCYIQPVNEQQLLDGAAYAPVTFRARVAYKYQLENTKALVIKDPVDPEYEAISQSLQLTTIGGQPESTDAPYKQEYSFLLSNQRQAQYWEIEKAMDEFEEFNSLPRDDPTRLFALAYIYYHWDQLSINRQSGNYVVGSRFSPMLMDVAKYDELINKGLIQPPQANSASVGNASQTISVPVEQSITDKRAILAEKGFEYGLLYMKNLISECNIDGGIDSACVFGKYKCSNTFVWGDFNSCGSGYDTCAACHSTIIPKMYTYVKDIACRENEQSCWGKVE